MRQMTDFLVQFKGPVLPANTLAGTMLTVVFWPYKIQRGLLTAVLLEEQFAFLIQVPQSTDHAVEHISGVLREQTLVVLL